jgi:glutamate-ammonia-ligase adenylyltransferase
MVSERARSSPLAALSRLGFSDPRRAMSLFADPALSEVVDLGGPRFVEGLPQALSAAADPDLALLGLLRLLGAADTRPDLGLSPAFLRADTLGRRRLIAVLGLSTAFGDQLTRHPEHWRVLTGPPPRLPGDLRDDLLQAVGADPQAAVPVAGLSGTPAREALRIAYRRRLLAVAGRDLDAADPTEVVDQVSVELADLAAAALEAALAVARAETDGHGLACRLAVIGMGKCGGRELNYVSDVDVIYVAEPREGLPEAEALRVGAQLAAQLAGICSVSTGEGSLWPVDAALRPEGRDGPLVGQDVGVSGVAEGPTGCRRRRGGKAVPGGDLTVRLVGGGAGELRRRRAGDATSGRGARAGPRGRTPTQARTRRPARRRVQHSTAAARARSHRRAAAHRQHPRRHRAAVDLRLHRP